MGKSFLQRFHARMYAGSWRNPLFADPRKIEKNEQTRSLVGTGLIIASALCTLASLAFWYGTRPAFALESISANGPRSFSEKRLALFSYQELRSCTKMQIPCLYTWNIPRAHLSKRLQETFPLESVTIVWENTTLTISGREKVVVVPLRMHDALWLAEKDGVLVRETTANELGNGVLIPPDQYYEIDVSATRPQAEMGMQGIATETLHIIETYKQALQAEDVVVRMFVLTDDPGKIIARTETYEIYLSPWEDPYKQSERLSAVLARATPSTYADIRFGERIYVK